MTATNAVKRKTVRMAFSFTGEARAMAPEVPVLNPGKIVIVMVPPVFTLSADPDYTDFLYESRQAGFHFAA
jgi:hypothetical protein